MSQSRSRRRVALRTVPRMHTTLTPSILYFGTPVALISTLNDDGTPNLAPMSSVWWLGWNAVLGFGARSHTPRNLLARRECVINLPSMHQAALVDALAKTTGSNPVPAHKLAMGYRHVQDKFALAGVTAEASTQVGPPRVRECPVQLEARLTNHLPLRASDPAQAGRLLALEVEVVAVHVDSSLVLEGTTDHVDPAKWRPLIMSFQELCGTTGPVHVSTLATIPQRLYRPAAPAARS